MVKNVLRSNKKFRIPPPDNCWMYTGEWRGHPIFVSGHPTASTDHTLPLDWKRTYVAGYNADYCFGRNVRRGARTVARFRRRARVTRTWMLATSK